MGVGWSFHQLLIISLVLLLLCAKTGLGTTLGLGKVGCIDRERQALLKFKHGLVDDYGVLSSWGEEQDKRDCCHWRGVRCSNASGHVISLHLPAPLIHGQDYNYYQSLRGQISPSVLVLEQLTHLDLSYNDFEGTPIPPFLSSLRKLQYLNLSHVNFTQTVPTQLGNLSDLLSLDLSFNDHVQSGELEWLSHLSSLRFLDLSGVDLSAAIHWSQSIDSLPSLIHLNLDRCNLPPLIIGSIFHANSSAPFVFLDLSYNSGIGNSIFPWLFNLSTTLIHLDLGYNYLDGSIPDSLWNITSLTYLDLSENKLGGGIPNTIANLASLTYLDLSGNLLEGEIPDSVGNMVSLERLDLSRNQLQGAIPDALGELSSLAYLDLSANLLTALPKTLGRSLVRVDISSNELNDSIPDAFGNAASLQELHLDENRLQGEIPTSLPRSLVTLDLSSNQLQGSIPDTIGDMASLECLFLAMNQLQGQIPKSLSNLCNLQELDLDSNNLTGQIPQGFLACANTALSRLSFSYNQLNGTLPASIGQLATLHGLDIRSNSLQGAISEAHFLNLSDLHYLDLSYNSLTFNISLDWVPPFQLNSLLLTSCVLGHPFPGWLQNQRKLYVLDLSDSNISDVLPDWFPNITTEVWALNISNNKIRGRLPNLSLFPSLRYIDFSFNHFEGSIPQLPSMAYRLDLSNNKLSGSISSFCAFNSSYLAYLDISNNLLTGPLPNCWSHWKSLVVLNLDNNNFFGRIPNSIGTLHLIKSLHMRNNNFSGELPFSMKKCTRLRLMDLSKNRLFGKIPPWIGGSLQDLTILSLRSNKFNGSIHSNLCRLKEIQILDFASNDISGVIPRCLNNLTMMTMEMSSIIFENHFFNLEILYNKKLFWNLGSYVYEALLQWKGREFEYKNILGLVKSIDFSSNNLVGGIPKEIANLVGLVSLNLSRNNLTGSIPTTIGQLKSLDMLDLSQNELSGEIPTRLSEISGLSVLNLSHNSLSGKIPRGTQLQIFSTNSYDGNPALCGLPLLNKCLEDRAKQGSPAQSFEDDGVQENGRDMWLYISIALGFIVGFWGVCGALILSSSWRIWALLFY